MSDPIKDLQDFTTEGLPMTTPLAPSEVRRRGDRMRRRNNALAAVAGVAAVALVAVPIAVLAGGGDREAQPAPGPTVNPSEIVTTESSPAPSVVTAIPDGFPLAWELQRQEDGTTPKPSREELGPQIPAPCQLGGTDTYDSFVDVLGVRATYPAEGSDGRVLRTFDNAEVATKAMEAVRHAAELCPTDATLVWTLDGLELGDEAFTLVQTYDTGLGGVIYQFVRVGNAVLVSEAGGEWELTSTVPIGIEERTAIAERLSQEMCVFAEHPCTVEGGPSGGAIPADFPLDIDQLEGGGDFERVGPQQGGPGLGVVELCGSRVWPQGPVDRMTSNLSGPEYLDNRELVTMVDAESAAAVLDNVRNVLATCTEDDTRVVTQHESDTGYDAVTLSITYTQGLGAEVISFMRVGHAILARWDSGEGTLAGVPDSIADWEPTARAIGAQMCLFTEAGC